jgi:maltodextrin utilization protein YvdJ
MGRIIILLIIFGLINFYFFYLKLNAQNDTPEQIKRKKADIILEMKRNPFEGEDKEKNKEQKTKVEKGKEKTETKKEKGKEKNIKIVGKIEYEKLDAKNRIKTTKDKIVIVEIDNKTYILRQGDKIEDIKIDKIGENEVEMSIEKEKIRKSF